MRFFSENVDKYLPRDNKKPRLQKEPGSFESFAELGFFEKSEIKAD